MATTRFNPDSKSVRELNRRLVGDGLGTRAYIRQVRELRQRGYTLATPVSFNPADDGIAV